MSIAFEQPTLSPAPFQVASDARWKSALARARLAGVQVRQLAGSGQWIVTSASDPTVAYETDGTTCNCAAALLGGDPVCLHRAALRNHLDRPEPEPPAHTVYDPNAEALRWAHHDRDRAYRDLERYNARIERGDVLNDREWAGFLRAQEREQDAHNRIVALKATQIVQVAA